MDGKTFLGGMAMGAVLAMTLDPSRGGRRRALVRDRIVRWTHRTCRKADLAITEAANRARGLVAAGRGRFQSDEVDDVRLVERVRSRVNRACSHPRAVEVEARAGEIALRGPILAHEVSDVLAAAASVRGVHAIVNALEPHESADGIPALQGPGRLADLAFDLLQDTWVPALRALVGLAAIAASSLAMAAYVRR